MAKLSDLTQRKSESESISLGTEYWYKRAVHFCLLFIYQHINNKNYFPSYILSKYNIINFNSFLSVKTNCRFSSFWCTIIAIILLIRSIEGRRRRKSFHSSTLACGTLNEVAREFPTGSKFTPNGNAKLCTGYKRCKYPYWNVETPWLGHWWTACYEFTRLMRLVLQYKKKWYYINIYIVAK